MYSSAFTDDEKKFILQFVRQFDEAKLETAAPSCHFIILAGEHHFAELFDLFLRVFVRCTATETVKLFIIVILDAFADSSQQTVFFTSLVLSATFFIHFHYGRNLFQFTFLNLFVDAIIISFADKHGNYRQDYQANNQYPHNVLFFFDDESGSSQVVPIVGI